MAAEIAERPNGITIAGAGSVNPTVEVEYLITGADTLAEAMALLNGAESEVPLQFDLFGSGNVLVPLASVNPDEVGGGIWEAIARYNYTDVTLSEMEYSFETGGGTQHITHSLATYDYAPDGKTAPPSHGLIGATADGVEGVDIGVPEYRWAETHPTQVSIITDTWKGIVYNLTNTFNATTFRGFPSGTVQFLGMTGTIRGGESVAYLTVRFAASPTLENFTIGDSPDQIVVPIKRGWDYLTIRSDRTAEGNVLNQKPIAAYVHRVLEPGEFSNMGYGS